MKSLSRRQFLQIAGGVTFFALTRNESGVYAAETTPSSLPLFIVPPYIQPGPASKLADGAETLVVAWQTEHLPAAFEVTYGPTKALGATAAVIVGERIIGRAPKADAAGMLTQMAVDEELIKKRINYSAMLTGLRLNTRYYYKVSGNGQTIAEGFATTRKPRGTNVRFVTFGDNSFGDVSDRAIAYYTYSAMPDFVMNTGDTVYESGLDNEYARYFFPSYNADCASVHNGAPLLRSVPFYTVIANHDVTGKVADGGPVADFDANRDSLGYYTAMSLPLNGPASIAKPTPTACSDPAVLAQFQNAAGARFPRMANYSYDVGDAHFLCLDSNNYVDPTNPALQAWIDADLAATDAKWKFVVYHHPGFNVGEQHYEEQHMRCLCPLLEKHGVDIVFSGHEHTYQRTMPLRFAPTDLTKTAAVGMKDRRTPGTFTVDRKFNGSSVTKPNGVIYVTTGAGGKELYDPGFGDNPAKWKTDPSEAKPYTAKFYSASHSLTIVDIEGGTLTMRQVNEFGMEVDRVRVTKA